MTESRPAFPTRRLFGLDIWSASRAAALAALTEAATSRGADGCRVVVTPNVDHLVRLEDEPTFKALYASADFIFPDGMPVVWASRLLGRPLTERITGADLFVDLCRLGAQHGWEAYILGGMPGQEATIRSGLEGRFPGLRVQVQCPSMAFDPDGPEAEEALTRIAAGRPQLVFACLGLPKQELWLLHHRRRLQAGIGLGVGAALEFALGTVKRSPLWMQRAGLEWFWRLASNPRKLWRRYLVNDSRFLPLLLREWRARPPLDGKP